MNVPLKYGSDTSGHLDHIAVSAVHSRWAIKVGGAFVAINLATLAYIVVVARQNTDTLMAIQREQRHQVPAILPSKFAVQNVTPRRDQGHRGTCWDFATISTLEWSYRDHGLRNGWLQSDEYVAFSQQAYGIEVMRLCTGEPTSPQQKACRTAGSNISNNSTDGGEPALLYYLRNGLKNSLLPTAVCPYFKEGHDHDCPGLDEALALNPVRFNVKSIRTLYDTPSIKQHLALNQQSMIVGTPEVNVNHYYPCIGPFLADRHCQLETCTLCPPSFALTTCCVPVFDGDNPNMEGEYFAHAGMVLDDGHAMELVGYNDAFQNHEGEVGGFIVKNSWVPAENTGSHSLQWWLQDVSAWGERTICPNSYNPINWYACGGVEDELTAFPGASEGIDACMSNVTRMFAKTNVQTLDLKCSDATKCKVSDDVTYYVRNTTTWGDRMTLMCMWEHDAKTGSARDFCLIPMLEQNLAATFKPKVVLDNDPDRCGFNFLSYEAVTQYKTLFGDFEVDSFDIEWHPSSYVANAADYPHFDYSLLRASTLRQHQTDLDGPNPYAKVV
ncbi:hypothetical protein H257_03862 [Aphanomyces astaci]|uniref:Peptidase C1A papain C-terminal domain-containing protein n=1 Tax=Aphanomyces astaci TaxID=112090 RepID=W4GYG3_APHAT|nr:hypothetical protein H257_03862 [Aphanomyces astaci]ETV84765.1 hypothetical protein H257_03862 [Aphanomyces astaci]|eukprot:XP_009826457.1 hypothetical protein H257_03862 [Aphanomyces astaci]